MLVQNINHFSRSFLIFLLLVLFLFVFPKVTLAKSSEPGFMDRFTDAVLGPLENISEMVEDNFRQHEEDVFSKDPEKAEQAVEEMERQREEFPKEAAELGEEGVEEVSGLAGLIKDVVDFFKRLTAKRAKKETDPANIYNYITLGYDWKSACRGFLNPKAKKKYYCKKGPCGCQEYHKEKEKESIQDCRGENISLKDCILQKSFVASPEFKDYWNINFLEYGELEITPIPSPSPRPTVSPKKEPTSAPDTGEYFNPWSLIDVRN